MLCPRENLWHTEGRSTELGGKDEVAKGANERARERGGRRRLDDAA